MIIVSTPAPLFAVVSRLGAVFICLCDSSHTLCGLIPPPSLGEALWEPSALGYTKSDGLLVLANGEIIEDPAKVSAQVRDEFGCFAFAVCVCSSGLFRPQFSGWVDKAPFFGVRQRFYWIWCCGLCMSANLVDGA